MSEDRPTVKVSLSEFHAHCLAFVSANLPEMVEEFKARSEVFALRPEGKANELTKTIVETCGVSYAQAVAIAKSYTTDAAFDYVLRVVEAQKTMRTVAASASILENL